MLSSEEEWNGYLKTKGLTRWHSTEQAINIERNLTKTLPTGCGKYNDERRKKALIGGKNSPTICTLN